MAARNPNWHNMQHQTNIESNSPLFSLLHHQLSLHGDGHGGSPKNSSSSSSSTSSIPFNPPHQEPWSQILMSGAQIQGMNLSSSSSSLDHPKDTNPSNENMLFGHGDGGGGDDDDDHHEHEFIKQEVYGHGGDEHGHDMDYHHEMASTWPHMVLPSPKSCTTTLSSNNKYININSFMDFSSNSCKEMIHAQPSFECNIYSTAGGAPKKPRVQYSSIPPLKVRKEKLGDRITALHQLVSPFGKTDTASVLIETIGCIRFLQAQIQVLSSPYLGSPPSKSLHFDESVKELKSRGLCLIPTSSLTHFAGTDNNNSAAEYWAAPSLASGF